MNSLQTKLNLLREQIRRTESAVVAFSGGVDSTFVLKVAHEVLGAKVIGVTALSESLPSGELEAAQKLADQIGVRHVVLRTFETQDQNYLANAANRCYFCKTEMYSRMLGVGQVRVRHHGETARIEVEPPDFLLVRTREREIAAHLNSLGFANVVLDPEGYRYRTGSGSDPITDSTWEKPLATARGTDTGF